MFPALARLHIGHELTHSGPKSKDLPLAKLGSRVLRAQSVYHEDEAIRNAYQRIFDLGSPHAFGYSVLSLVG